MMKVETVLPRLLGFMFKALQEYAFGLIVGAHDRKVWMMRDALVLEFGDVLHVSFVNEAGPFGGVLFSVRVTGWPRCAIAWHRCV